jgi:hypothetical protein
MPIAATRHTAAGAQAFAKFFIQTIDWGYATIDGSYLHHYSLPGCTTCNSLVTGFDADRKAGDHYIGGRSTIVAARPGDRGASSQIVTINSTSFEKTTKNGKFITGDQAYTGQRFEVDLSWQQSRWSVLEVVVVQ